MFGLTQKGFLLYGKTDQKEKALMKKVTARA
jgi:hypothetical protein